MIKDVYLRSDLESMGCDDFAAKNCQMNFI